MYNVTTGTQRIGPNNVTSVTTPNTGRIEYADLSQARDFASVLHGKEVDAAMKKFGGKDYQHIHHRMIGYTVWYMATVIANEQGNRLAIVRTEIRDC